MARSGITVLALLVLAACGGGEASPRALPLTDALLEAARHWGQGSDRGSFARAELARIAARVRVHAEREPAHQALAQVVFQELRFAREVEDESLDYVFLPSVLEHRRGSCVGLGSLYLALAERLGWRMHGILLPGHFFVVLDERGVNRSIELLHRGDVMPEGWHRERFGAPSAPAYARALSHDAVLGIVEFDVGNQRKREGRLQQAQRAYESARRHFPDFAEAHASVGAVAQMLGALDYSLEAYRDAQRVNPALPGVAANLALLAAEREHGRLPLPP